MCVSSGRRFMKFRTLTNILLIIRLLDRRKATKGLALKTLVQRGDENKMLKCLLMMDDM